jgi:H+/Cl- antiporter ClcA
VLAQLFHLTSAERKTLLVAGAAAGMSATFAAPVASVLLAVELLLFEWKPRSLVPVALASATAAGCRSWLLGLGPLFPVTAHPAFVGGAGLAGCLLAGVLAGAASGLLTAAVYASEDAFARLPIHWMWWPAIGGVVIGAGGLLFPEALGVGYDTIGALLAGDVARRTILGVLIVKAADLVGVARLGHVGRRAGAAADDRRRARRASSGAAADLGPGLLAAGQHGRRCWAAPMRAPFTGVPVRRRARRTTSTCCCRC